MLQPLRHRRFTLKAGQVRRLVCPGRGQNFQGMDFAGVSVAGSVNVAHSSASDSAEQLVWTEKEPAELCLSEFLCLPFGDQALLLQPVADFTGRGSAGFWAESLLDTPQLLVTQQAAVCEHLQEGAGRKLNRHDHMLAVCRSPIKRKFLLLPYGQRNQPPGR